MTQLNYSNLPEQAQQAIKKLTGYNDEQLNGKPNPKPNPKQAKSDYIKLPHPKILAVAVTGAAITPLIIVALWLLAAWLTG